MMYKNFDASEQAKIYEQTTGKKPTKTLVELLNVLADMFDNAYAQGVADGRKAVQA